MAGRWRLRPWEGDGVPVVLSDRKMEEKTRSISCGGGVGGLV